MAKKGDKLTPKQEAFCKLYLELGNATAAYRKAYKAENQKPTTAQSNAKRLMRTTTVRLRIEELKAERTPSEHGLTPKQEAFCLAYLETGNASESYRRAYDVAPTTKPNTVEKRACELMASGKIAGRIAELRAAAAKRNAVTVDRIVQEYAKMGFANMMDYITVNKDGTAHCDLSKLTRDQAAAIQEMTFETVLSSDPDAVAAAGLEADEHGKLPRVAVLKTKFKLADKKAALSDLGKHLGMFEADNRQKGEAEAAAVAQRLGDIEQARRVAFALGRALKRSQQAKTADAA